MSDHSIVTSSAEDRSRVLEALRKNPGPNAWAIQDLVVWPDRTSLHYIGQTLGSEDFTYLLQTGHPGAQRTKTIVLSGDAKKAGPLLARVPSHPWLLRESPASMLTVLEPRYPDAKVYLEDRMQVERSSFRPVEATAIIRRLVATDAPALADMKGAPPQATLGFAEWINGAQLYGLWHEHKLAAIASTFVTMPEVWELIGIETNPKFRGLGYGTQVTSMLTALALEHAPMVTLTVLKDNEPAQRLYKKLGYRHCEDRIWFDNGTGSRP